MGGTVSLRQHLPVDFIIVKGRKDVNAAERRATNDDRQGILPVHPYLFRAGGAAAGHTVVYCAQTVPGGVLAQLRWEQAGRVQCSTVLAPQGSFARMMQLLRYLCENSIGPEQWLEVLEDVHQPYRLLPEAQQPADIHPESGCFCGIC